MDDTANTRKYKAHSFSCKLARKHGVLEALLLARLAYKLTHSGTMRHGKRWYFATIDEWASNYPYFSRTAVADALRALSKDVLRKERHNKCRYDRTGWYRFNKPADLTAARKNLIYFRVQDAVAYGVCGAVLLQNLRHWLKDGPRNVSPTRLAKLLPFSVSSIKRSLSNLEEEGVINKVGPKYCLGGSKPYNDTHLKSDFQPGPDEGSEEGAGCGQNPMLNVASCTMATEEIDPENSR